MPAGVQRATHNAQTFQPYDPSETLGDTAPTTLQPTPKKNKCGVLGRIFVAIIAFAVEQLLNKIIPGVGGFVGKTIRSIAIKATAQAVSQAVAVATGIQDKFSWNAVALTALSAGVNASPIGRLTSSGAANAMISSAVTQGVGVATGLQDKFDWAGVAAAGVGSYVGAKVANALPKSVGPMTASTIVSTAQLLANAGAHSLIDGSDFGDNILAALPDVIGQTIGGAFANGLSGAGKSKPLTKPKISVFAPMEKQSTAPVSELANLPNMPNFAIADNAWRSSMPIEDLQLLAERLGEDFVFAQVDGSQAGPRLTYDGDVRYYTFDNGVELFPIVRLGNERFTDTATRALGELDLDLVVNGAFYGFTDGGSYPLNSPLMPIDPDNTLTQGLVVGAGVQLAGRSAPDMAYFAKVVQMDGSIGYRFGIGDPPITSSIAAFGGAMPLIIDGLPYGEINLYSGASRGAPRTGDPGSFRGSLTQRSNATFSSFVSRYKGGGNFSTGKVIVAYNSQSGAVTVVVQQDGVSNGRSLASIRDNLRRLGYDNAVAFDGSSSTTLVTPQGTVASPDSYKNNTIGTGIGFRMPSVAPPSPATTTRPRGT